jgi:LmbE family N-acetylglucosaminyl deacetylase
MDPTQLYHPRGVPDDSIGLMVDTSSVARRVVAALEEHRTQANDIQEMSEDERLLMVSREHGIVTWPAWERGDPVLRDVFEGLD